MKRADDRPVQAFAAHRARLRALVLLVAVSLCAAASSSADSEHVVVGLDVPSWTSINATGCASPTFGTVQPSTTAITPACQIEFGSSNDSSALRVFQRDRDGRAMTRFNTSWELRSGAPALYRATFADADHGWIVGQSPVVGAPAVVRTTTDAGDSWGPQPACPTATRLDFVHAFSTTEVLAAGNVACRTTDGGETWQHVTTPDAPACNAANGAYMHVVPGTQVAWVVCRHGSNNVYRSDDHGQTWTRKLLPAQADRGLRAVIATSDDDVLVLARQVVGANVRVTIWKTGDGGDTWAEDHLATVGNVSSSHWYDIDRSPTGVLIASGLGSIGMWRSVDDGATWTQVETFISRTVRHVTGQVWVAAANDGTTRRSTNDGTGWSTVPVTRDAGVTKNILGFSNVVGSTLYMVGADDAIRRSTNDGASFAQTADATPSYLAAVHFGDRRFVTLGEKGVGVRSSDGGASLTDVSIGSGAKINDAVRTGPDAAVAVGASGTITRTADAGATWNAVTSPVGVALFDVARARSAGDLLAVGAAGTMIRSRDAGATWSSIAVPTAGTMDAVAVSDDGQRIWAGTNVAGQIVRSLDGGTTWATITTGGTSAMEAMDVSSNGTLLALHVTVANENPVVGRSTDDGDSWVLTPMPFLNVMHDVRFVSPQRAWLVGTVGRRVRTDDAGATFLYDAAHVGGALAGTFRSIVDGDANTLVVVGTGGMVVTTTPAASVPDFDAGDDDFSSSGGAFGACLQTASGTSTTEWFVAGACDTEEDGHWNRIPVTPLDAGATIARTAAPGTAQIGIRFGVRTASNQEPGTYVADLVAEVVAPAT